ncbi:MAG: hypothetical protein AB1540_00580 [Bdellovibrionota bacterium]
MNAQPKPQQHLSALDFVFSQHDQLNLELKLLLKLTALCGRPSENRDQIEAEWNEMRKLVARVHHYVNGLLPDHQRFEEKKIFEVARPRLSTHEQRQMEELIQEHRSMEPLIERLSGSLKQWMNFAQAPSSEELLRFNWLADEFRFHVEGHEKKEEAVLSLLGTAIG